MNATEIVKFIVEAEHEEFDPREFVKSAKNRESAVEIYNGPLVRVIQPLSSYTLNNYLGPGEEWDEKVYRSIEQEGPLYLAVDKSNHDNLAIIQPTTGKCWNGEGREQDWKELPNLINQRGDGEGRNWLDLQQGLATFFMAQIAKKKNVGQWVKFLTMIGRTDLATNYARYLGRAKLPLGKSIDAVFAMKKAGKRSRNRIARLMKNQKNVKWGEQGFWLLFNDWSDLAPFYGEGRNYNYAKNAEKIFGGDTWDWFAGNSNSKAEDVWSNISDKNMSIIKQLLVNRTVYNSEGEEHLATREFVDELTDDEIKDIVCDRGNKGDSCEDIYDAIGRAADDAYVSEMENAYYTGYQHALMKEWGLKEDDTIKWVKVGKRAPDKKLENGMVEKGEQKTMLGLWFPYSTLDEWMKQWKEDEYEDDYYGDIHDLAAAYLPKVMPNEEYWGGNDSDYFNEQLDYHLSEIELTAPPKQEDPGQSELPLQGEPAPQTGGKIDKPYTVQVGEPPNQKEYKNVLKSEATKYREAMKPQRDDITFRAESFLAHPLNRLDEAAGDVKIEFTASDEAAESVVPLLKELQKMGRQGSSRNVKIEDWDGKSSFGFDGDGASKLGDIKVNGQVVEAQQLDEAIYKRSTTQIDIPGDIGQHIISWGELNIADDDLYIDEKDGCGRETEQHVTVLYGLTDPSPPEELRQIVKHTKPFLIEFGGVSIFENEKYDVIKLDVISEELHNLHMEIRRACPNENKFPDYIPHCTIAYVKPGLGKKYAGQDVFKTAKVPRDFWAYDLKFKGAGDSEDANRVVELIAFDKSKDPEEADEPEAGEKRYAMAESDQVDPKAFLAQSVPVACPECHSHNLSDPDEEGLVDCFDCGIWFDPFHPENKPVRESGEIDPKAIAQRTKAENYAIQSNSRHGGQAYWNERAKDWTFEVTEATFFPVDIAEFLVSEWQPKCPNTRFELIPKSQALGESDEIDPKKFTERPGSVDPHPDWQVIDRAEDKNGRIKVLYRHKNGRVFFKLLNEFFGDDTPRTSLNDWSVYVYGGADGKDFMDGEDFKAGSFDEAESTATNIAFTIVHSTAPSYFDPPKPRRGRQQESDQVDPKALIAKIPHHELQHWNEGGPDGGYQCSCGEWRYRCTGWSSSIQNAMKEFRAHKRLMMKKAKLGEAEEVNTKEFLDRATRYRVRRGVGPQTRYLNFDLGTGGFKWVDFEQATAFTAEKAEEMLDWVGEIYGGQIVQAELVDDNHPQSHLGESHPGPFEDDGLPGEVTSFLRKVRSKRKRPAPANPPII